MHSFDTKEPGEKSMQELYMDINRCYAEKCLGQLRKLGLQPGQMPVLMILSHSDGCSQRRMAEFLRNKPSTVNVSIQRLEKAGIVCRRRDEKDQRVMRVYLTEKGKETMTVLKTRFNKMEKKMFGNFSETELCLLRRFFRQMLENLEQIPGTCKQQIIQKEGLEE